MYLACLSRVFKYGTEGRSSFPRDHVPVWECATLYFVLFNTEMAVPEMVPVSYV